MRGRSRFGQLVLIDSSAEGVPVDVIVDSGLQVSVGNEALRRLLTSRRNRFTQIELLSITGESFDWRDYTRVDNLRIGGVAIAGMPVAFANAHFFRRMRPDAPPRAAARHGRAADVPRASPSISPTDARISCCRRTLRARASSERSLLEPQRPGPKRVEVRRQELRFVFSSVSSPFASNFSCARKTSTSGCGMQ